MDDILILLLWVFAICAILLFAGFLAWIWREFWRKFNHVNKINEHETYWRD